MSQIDDIFSFLELTFIFLEIFEKDGEESVSTPFLDLVKMQYLFAYFVQFQRSWCMPFYDNF